MGKVDLYQEASGSLGSIEDGNKFDEWDESTTPHTRKRRDMSDLQDYAGGGISIPIQSAPPSSPSQDDLYIDEDDNTLYRRDGNEWIAIGGAGGASGSAWTLLYSTNHNFSANDTLNQPTGSVALPDDAVSVLLNFGTQSSSATTRSGEFFEVPVSFLTGVLDSADDGDAAVGGDNYIIIRDFIRASEGSSVTGRDIQIGITSTRHLLFGTENNTEDIFPVRVYYKTEVSSSGGDSGGLTQNEVDSRITTLRPNPFTDDDELKLDGIDPGADVNVGVEFTSILRSKLNEIDDDATDDQTGSEIVSAIDSQLGNTDWQTGGDPFDIHDDVTDPATIADADRIAFSDEGSTGDPMRYSRADNIRTYMQQGIQSGGGLNQSEVDARITTLRPNPFTDADESAIDSLGSAAQATLGNGAGNVLALGTNRRFPPARLGGGTADNTTVLYGDGQFRVAPEGGDDNLTTEEFQDAVGMMAGDNLAYDDATGMLNATGNSEGVAYTKTQTGTLDNVTPDVVHNFTLSEELTLGMFLEIEWTPESGTTPLTSESIPADVLLGLTVDSNPTTGEGQGAYGFIVRNTTQSDITQGGWANLVYIWRRSTNNRDWSIAFSTGGTVDLEFFNVVIGGAQGIQGVPGPTGSPGGSGTIVNNTLTTIGSGSIALTNDSIPILDNGILKRILASNFVTWIKGQLGTAASADTGTSQNNVPILNSIGDLPLSVVPSLPASIITSGTLNIARIPIPATATLNSSDYIMIADQSDSWRLKRVTRASLAAMLGGGAPTIHTWTHTASLAQPFQYSNITPPSDTTWIFLRPNDTTVDDSAFRAHPWSRILYAEWAALAAIESGRNYGNSVSDKSIPIVFNGTSSSLGGIDTFVVGRGTTGVMAFAVAGASDPSEDGVKVIFE